MTKKELLQQNEFLRDFLGELRDTFVDILDDVDDEVEIEDEDE